MNSKKTIAIVAGGDSSESVVSLRSAQGIRSFMDRERYDCCVVRLSKKEWIAEVAPEEWVPVDKNDFSFTRNGRKQHFDFAYITIHGTPGENGILQGYFELIGLPYSTCDVLASSLTFNKYVCNRFLEGFGVTVATSRLIRRGERVSVEELVKTVGLPCFVKPNAGGSSFGTTKVKTADALQPAVEKAFEEGSDVIVEAFMAGTEITCGCFKAGGKLTLLPISEVVSKNEFFDYEAKYTASRVEEITPARLPEALTREVQELTGRIYELLGCRGITRTDYILVDGKPHLLEVNTTPGMTETSFIPQQVRAAGLQMGDVLAAIIENEG